MILLEKAKVLFVNLYLRRKNFDPEESILIFSDPRGGSTWLAEMLNTIADSFIVWEPLSLTHVKEARKVGFSWRQHIPKDASWKEARLFFDKILSVRILNKWTTQKIRQKELKGKFKVPIIKICRGNHLIEWLVNQYNFKYRPIYLVRHPMAVVASQMKQGGWNYTFTGYNIPKTKYNEVYSTHESYLKSLETKEEALTATWCITNGNLLKNKSQKWILIHYEDLIMDPYTTIEEVFLKLEMEQPDILKGRARLWSSTTLSEKSSSVDMQMKKWKSELSNDQLERMNRVLKYFDIKRYSIEDITPLKTEK